MDNLAADFTIENNTPFEVEYELSENKNFDCSFTIFATPDKVSQLENDLSFQTEEQVAQNIQEAIEPLQEEINSKIETIEGSELIGVSRAENTVTLTSQTFVFEQGIPATEWVINHNLNKFPSVTLVDSSGRQFKAQIDYTNLNNLTVSMNGGTAGKAYLN